MISLKPATFNSHNEHSEPSTIITPGEIKENMEEIEEETYECDWDALDINDVNSAECTPSGIDYNSNSDLSIGLTVDIEENSESCDLSSDSKKKEGLDSCDAVKNTSNEPTKLHVSSLVGIDHLKNNPAAVLHFSGLENYNKFKIVFYSLDPKLHYLKYDGNRSF